MDYTGLVLGLILASLHWWLFEKFVLSMGERPNLLGVVLVSGGRWMLTVALGVAVLQFTSVSAFSLVLGFMVATMAARTFMVMRYRSKLQ
jgi:uncharacterized membrane protein YobD (UPF0266 family)